MPNGAERRPEPPTEPEMERVERAKQVALDRLLSIPGVHMVGIGYKRRGGEMTDELAVIVYVDEKLRRADVDPHRLVPPEIRFFLESTDQEELVPTDVVERPRAVEYPHIPDGTLATRIRPVPGGRSITRAGSGGGTLGGWVWDDLNDETVLLTNNHVLGSVAGTDVFQPWSSNAATDHLADVVRTGLLDATIAVPVNDADVQLEIEGIGPAVYEVAPATLGMQVEKSGATTEHTTGFVVTIGLTGHSGSTNDFEVDPDTGVDRFAYYGDSGSLIVERTNPSGASWKRVVGLLWGGVPSERNAYAHQLEDVFADLDLTTVCAGALSEFFDNLFARSFEAVPSSRLRPTLRRLVRPTLPGARFLPSEILARIEELTPWRRAPQRGFARDVEKRLKGTGAGSDLIAAVHERRVGLVRLVFDRETRRALAAAAAPFAEDTWTPDELLHRQVSDDDVVRFRRVVNLAEERRSELGELLERANEILDGLSGRSLAEVLR
jgi:hypothetical protein